MSSFGDIVPVVEVVDLRGKKVKMHALPFEDIVQLVRRFEQVASLVSGEASAVQFAMAFPAAVAAILAAGLGKLGDEEEEKKARRLGLGDQVSLLLALRRATIGEGGVGPFVEQMRELGVDKMLAALWAAMQSVMKEATQSSAPSSPSPNSTESVPSKRAA